MKTLAEKARRALLVALLTPWLLLCLGLMEPSPDPAPVPQPDGTLAVPAPEPEKILVRVVPMRDTGEVVIRQGQVFLVEVRDPGRTVASVTASWRDVEIPCLPMADDILWQGLGSAEQEQTPGPYELRVRIETTLGDDQTLTVPIQVMAENYPSERLTVNPDKVTVPPSQQRHVAADRAAFRRTWAHPAAGRFWSGPFLRPCPGRITATFGDRRIYNGKMKSTHGGVDLAAATGEPIQVTAAGRVALVQKSFIEGGTVVVDHGGGIFSYYCHLSAFKVTEGQLLEKGEVVGLAGATGRVTGPHLHWGLRIQGSRANALTLLELNQWLEAEQARP